jgi:hypothetical protein
LLLLSPLVVVPLGLELAASSNPNEPPSHLWQWVVQLQTPAALVLVIAFALPAGLLAAVVSLPWFVTTVLIAIVGLIRICRRFTFRWEELSLNAGLVYLVVGGVWVVLTRWGARPLNFEPAIVLLTAIHFHYAGFVLPLSTGLAGRARGGATAQRAAFGVIIGVPLVAIGITTTQLGLSPLLECIAVCWTAVAGLLTAWLHLRLASQPRHPGVVRALWAIAAGSLAGSMVLAALYGCRWYLPLAWLDIPWMRALHGTTNALGLGLTGVVGWHIAARQRVSFGSPPGNVDEFAAMGRASRYGRCGSTTRLGSGCRSSEYGPSS